MGYPLQGRGIPSPLNDAGIFLEMTMGIGRSYVGKPDMMFESGAWDHAACWTDEDEKIQWFFFCRYQEHSTEWKTYKVVANGRVYKKANYWFAVNVITGQIAFSKDLEAMKTHRNRLYTKTMQIVCEK